MKFLAAVLILFSVSFSVVSAQRRSTLKFKKTASNSKPGYITINELTTGFGISKTNIPFSNSFFGVNTIHGYQMNQHFVIAFGTGLSFYNGGTLLPLFMDFRYRIINSSEITPYAFGDGGILFNVSNSIDDTRLFINPGIGFRYDLKGSLSVNLGTGIFMQQGTHRDTFINLKFGITYKPVILSNRR